MSKKDRDQTKGEGLKNPYDEGDDGQVFAMGGRKVTWAMVILFLGAIVIAPLCRHIIEWSKPADERWLPAVEFFHHPSPEAEAVLAKKRAGNPAIDRETPSIRDHLQSFEGGIKDNASYKPPIQQTFQGVFTNGLREGNTKTFIGPDGWLFYQPALEALGGYGPIKPEPDSVTKDPDRAIWRSPLPVIEEYIAQLEERGIELVLVPVPVKAMVYGDLFGAEMQVTHRDREAVLSRLRDSGATVVDVLPALVAGRSEGEVFFKQDTHWTQLGMNIAASEIAKAVPDIAQNLDSEPVDLMQRFNLGDLVRQLELGESGKFQPETEHLIAGRWTASGELIAADASSPNVILGDSFVNIFDDPKIGFGQPGWKSENTEGEAQPEPRIGAGIVTALSRQLGTTFDVYAVNGQGATGCREKFARRGKNIVAAKKVVIWMLAERDLFLSETPAGRAGVAFRTVTWNDQDEAIPARKSGAPDEVVLTAKLSRRSSIADPNATPYADSLFVSLFDVEDVVSGEYEDSTVLVTAWAFQNKIMRPESKIEVGKSYQLRLVPWESKTAMQTINVSDELEMFDAMWFANEISVPVSAVEGGEGQLKPVEQIVRPTVICFLVFSALVVAFVVWGVGVQIRDKSARV